MKFDLAKTIEILSRTPDVLERLLKDLPEGWTMHNEGGESWSPYDVLGHLVHGEKTDWISRTKIILENNNGKFTPFDRFAQFEDSKGKTLNVLLDEFKERRRANLIILKELNITEDQLDQTGIHPAFGEVTLRELLATWAVHDLNHIYQIARVMAKQYKSETGPWPEYLRILRD
jgi:hypothetical protein